MIRTLLDFLFCYEPGCWRWRPRYNENCARHDTRDLVRHDSRDEPTDGLGVELADDLEAITLRPSPVLRFDQLERKRKRDRKRLDL